MIFMSNTKIGPAVKALALGILSFVLFAPAFGQHYRAPNIIVILADDLGVESVESYGSEIATPNLSKLAQNGIQVENAYAMPICSPSRVRLLTGKDSSRNFQDFGHLGESEQTFARLARDAGYRTLVAGKWQLGDAWEPTIPLTGASPIAAGFDDYIVHNLTEGEVGSRYWGPTLYRNGRRERIEDRIYGSDLVNDHLLSFIDSNRDHPFLIFYSIFEPHDPWVLTPDNTGSRNTQQRYRDMVRYMDKLVGKVVDKVDSLCLRDNTLIIFTADNGNHPQIVVNRKGVPHAGGKGTTTRSGTHVPFIMSWPGRILSGQSSQSLVDIADIAPTIGDLVDRQFEGPLDGVSLMPLFRNPAQQVREAIVHNYRPTGRTPVIRYAFNTRYKLYEDGSFFDVTTDETETSSLDEKKLDREKRAARENLKSALQNVGP
jgi:arylsulfatase A-like enzyme